VQLECLVCQVGLDGVREFEVLLGYPGHVLFILDVRTQVIHVAALHVEDLDEVDLEVVFEG